MTAVFSKEYAASLVERARLGATFDGMQCSRSWECVHYHPRNADLGTWDRLVERGHDHWVEWYRETTAAHTLASWVASDSSTEYGTPRDGSWSDCYVQMHAIGSVFVNAIASLGSLCRLPAEWTDAHLEAAREIGRAKPC